MASNLVVAFLLVAAALIGTFFALYFVTVYIPALSLSGCWMSVQSQVKVLAKWDMIVLKGKVTDTLNLGSCVERVEFTNNPSKKCMEKSMEGVCPQGGSGYIIVCRKSSGIDRIEVSLKNVYGFCIDAPKPFSKEVLLPGEGKYCVEMDDIGDQILVSKTVGECREA